MSSQKLLLVEGTVDRLEQLGAALLKADYNVLTTHIAENVVQLTQNFQPDLVLLDHHYYNSGESNLTQLLFDNGILFVFICQHEIENVGTNDTFPDAILKFIPDIKVILKWVAEIRRLKETEQRYSKAIQTGRVVDVVIGILMERYHINRDDAFELFRDKARSERVKLRTLAQDILDTQEKLNQLFP
jgi:response regulator NasT